MYSGHGNCSLLQLSYFTVATIVHTPYRAYCLQIQGMLLSSTSLFMSILYYMDSNNYSHDAQTKNLNHSRHRTGYPRKLFLSEI